MTDSRKSGWVRLHREIENNFLWFLEPFTKAQAWVDLFLNANHKEKVISIRGNIIKIKRGQIGWSELTMADRWKWSKGKVRRFLKLLEIEQQIEQQKSPLTTVITILKYEHYQTDKTTDGQQKDSRQYTNKNVKNEKKLLATSDEVAGINEIFDLFYQSINPGINFGNKTNRKAVKWLINKWGLAEVLRITKQVISAQSSGDKFCPTATTPFMMKEKLGDFAIYFKKNKKSKRTII